jgi:hypothetical protein
MSEETQEIELVHPVTGDSYESAEELVDALVDAYNKAATEKYQADKEEREVLEKLSDLCGKPEKLKGTLHVFGNKNKVSIARKENVSYEYDRGEDHPLKGILREYPAEMDDKIRISYGEQGSAMQKFLDSDNLDPSLLGLRQKLEEVRCLKAGKPSITIKPIDTDE